MESMIGKDLNISVNTIIVNKIIQCCDDWFVNLIVASIEEPHQRLVYIGLQDPQKLLPEINHAIENNDLVKILIQYIMKSREELGLISGNTHPHEYRKNIAQSLYNLCLGEKENLKSSGMKSLI